MPENPDRLGTSRARYVGRGAYDTEGGRYCGRCGESVHAPDGPHLCADLRKRVERQTKAVALVGEALRNATADLAAYPIDDEWYEETALAVVRALAGRDLGVD